MNRVCRNPTCPHPATTGPYCDTCRPPRTRSHGFTYGRPHRRNRRNLFMREPLCRSCGQRVARILDHIVPLAEGGRDVPSNRQGLCIPCNEAKLAAENRRRAVRR